MARPKLNRPNYKIVRKWNGYFEIRWTENKRTRFLSTGEKSEAAANAALDRWLAGLDQPSPSAEPTIAEICDGYWLENGQKDNFLNSTKPIKRELGNLTPGMISQVTVRRYAVKRRDKANDTIRTELKYLLAACAWATNEWKTSPLKFKQPVMPSPPRDRWLSKDEARKLLECTKAHHTKLFILLALQTAQRGIAICDLTWETGERGQSVNFDTNLIDFGMGSGNKRRATVPMNNQLRSAMLIACEARTCDYVIEYASRKVLNPRKGVSRSAERAGLGKMGKHILRHTAASWMVAERRPYDEVARYMGTTADIVEQVYAKHHPDYLKGSATALEL